MQSPIWKVFFFNEYEQIHLCLYYHTVYTISDHWIMLSGPILHYCFRQARKTKCDRCTLRTCCPVRCTYKTTRQKTTQAQKNDPSRNYPTSKRPNLKTNQGRKRTKRKMNHYETTQAQKRTKLNTTQGTKRPKA
jgi:hypothetical protein